MWQQTLEMQLAGSIPVHRAVFKLFRPRLADMVVLMSFVPFTFLSSKSCRHMDEVEDPNWSDLSRCDESNDFQGEDIPQHTAEARTAPKKGRNISPAVQQDVPLPTAVLGSRELNDA
jgi:hypothetical protein